MSAAKGSKPFVTKLAELWSYDALANRVDPHRERRGFVSFMVRQVEIFAHTARSLGTEEVSSRAAGLTYYSMLSLVPLLAIAFALFKAFGGLRSLESSLKEVMVESLAAGRSDEVAEWLDKFVANINAGAIAGFGVVLLIYSALGLLTNIEKSFNRIWGIRRGRPIYLRFAIYWCIVTLAPPLIALSISASTQLHQSSAVSAVLALLPWGMSRLVLSLGSPLAMAMALILIYKIVPNTKVQFRCAILGGLVASVMWNISKILFISLTAGSVKYSAIYGALSTLPLLMLWLYVSWNIVLFGVTYTKVYQTIMDGRVYRPPVITEAYRARLAARLMVEVARAFRQGHPPPNAHTLAQAAGAPETTIQILIADLLAAGQISEVLSQDTPGYLPSRDLHATSLADTINALRGDKDSSQELAKDSSQRQIDELLQQSEQAMAEILGNVSLCDLADRASSPEGA